MFSTGTECKLNYSIIYLAMLNNNLILDLCDQIFRDEEESGDLGDKNCLKHNNSESESEPDSVTLIYPSTDTYSVLRN